MNAMKPCAQCGKLLDDEARVCTQCGFAVAPANALPGAAQTMLGFQSPVAKIPAQPTTPAAPAPTEPQKPMMQTMLGFAAPAELRANANPVAPATSPAPTAPAQTPFAAKTMLGMASPLAQPNVPATNAQPIAQAAPPASRFGGTMLGVAMPGIAPAHSQPGAPPPTHAPAPSPIVHEPLPAIVPAPAPFIRSAAPPPVVVVKKRGIPVAIFAVVALVIVVLAGATILYLSHGAPPLAATAKVSPDGKEQLHLRCETCADGTTAKSNGATTTFANKEADLDLPSPLVIGDNAFQIAIDRPGVGRDETVKLVLPLAYRIRGDLDGIAQTPPVIHVDVEAQKGATVTVDGKPVTLDASGKAVLTYDVTDETTGAADETRTIERKIPYEVVDKDKKKSNGDVTVRVAVVPLHVDAPSVAPLWTEDASVWVAGRTAKGAHVTANGASLPVAADGSFEGKVDVALGDSSIVVRAAPADGATKMAARSSIAKVTRVEKLAARGKAFDKTATLGFDAFASDPSTVGKPAVIVGSVADVRVAHHHAIVLVDDRRGCAKSPCLVRVEYGADSALRAGDLVVAYGILVKPVTTPDGKTLPALDASTVRQAESHER
jgi:hypothetical protein